MRVGHGVQCWTGPACLWWNKEGCTVVIADGSRVDDRGPRRQSGGRKRDPMLAESVQSRAAIAAGLHTVPLLRCLWGKPIDSLYPGVCCVCLYAYRLVTVVPQKRPQAQTTSDARSRAAEAPSVPPMTTRLVGPDKCLLRTDEA